MAEVKIETEKDTNMQEKIADSPGFIADTSHATPATINASELTPNEVVSDSSAQKEQPSVISNPVAGNTDYDKYVE
jgi:hypothetical protein